MTSPNENQTLILKYFEAFGDKNWEDIDVLLAEDVIWHVPGSGKVSSAGIGRGKEYVKSWIQRFENNFITKELSVRKLIPLDNEMLVFGHFSHQVVKTGRHFSGDFVLQFRIENGKIAKYQIFEDSYLVDKAFDPASTNHQNTITLNNIPYAYSDIGSGPPIIFAHGLFTDRSMFDAQFAAFASNYRCFNFDLPAHGRSGFRREGWSLDTITDDLALFIQESGLQKVTFIGQSQGGMIGMRLAARYPELVEGLVLIGTGFKAEEPDRLSFWTDLAAMLLTGSYEERSEAFWQIQVSTKSKNWTEENIELALKQKNAMLDLSPEGLNLAIQAAVLDRGDCADLLPLIQAKVLILHGSRDQAIPIEQAKKMADLCSRSQLEIIEGANHHLPLEKPEVVSVVISQFLKDHCSGGDVR